MEPNCEKTAHAYRHFILETLKEPPAKPSGTKLILSAILYCTKCGDIRDIEPKRFIRLKEHK